ncbi:hypothetical protein JRQ81_008699 [Phrynocephalus forsythii]|uniref:CD320 antigen n=1 Tax=Phrynocephalus forsythii TaxID=171643 RepID=A0A9Q1ASJ7_9SAUR|nr:hypothetical protein JRQ81_008699 [Phrynocephalus forsythii]
MARLLLLLLLLLALLVTVSGRFRARPADFSHCTLGHFRCDNGDQVPLCWRCDGEPACPDGSDEAGCHAGDISCGPRGRQCGHGGRCLPFERFCDGQQDCPDNSDESAQACGFGATGLPPPPPPHCRKDEFRCAPDAGCYPVAWVCDGHPDCPDARDERGCTLDFPSTTATVPATARTESPESPEVLKTEPWVIVAVVALLIGIVAGVAVSVWVRPRSKPLLVHFSVDKASEQLMRKDQP